VDLLGVKSIRRSKQSRTKGEDELPEVQPEVLSEVRNRLGVDSTSFSNARLVPRIDKGFEEDEEEDEEDEVVS
jgi:hypothetical protein